MSDFNREQETARDRKNPFTGIDAELRDQIPEALAQRLDDMGVGEQICKLFLVGNANRTTWLERQQVYLQDWDEFLISTAEGPFSGSSNLHLPMALVIAKTIHARFMQALLGLDPPFFVKGRTEGEVERATQITALMKFMLLEHSNVYKGIERTVDKWLWSWVTDGCGILKQRWESMFERFIDVVEVQEPGPPIYRQGPDGKQLMTRSLVTRQKDQFVTKKTFEGPVYELRPIEDILIIGGEGDIDAADSVIDRYFLTASEMWTYVDRKIFREEETKAVIEGGADHTMGSVAGFIKLQRIHDAGKASVRTAAELDRFEILETYIKLDVDGSGINSEIVVWVAYRSRKILRANYLRRMVGSGERPFSKIDFHLRPGSEYGTGIVEILHPLSVELDAIHNMRIDFGLINVMPFGFYRPTSNLQPEILNLEPGSLIPLDNPQSDVYFPNLGNRTAWGFQEEAAIMSMIERVSSINDLNQGVLSGAQGPTRTATGANALINESSANLDVYLRRLNLGWKRLLKMTFHMMQQRLPEGFQFRLTGDDGKDFWENVKGKDFLQGDFDFQILPNSSQSNPQIMQSQADAIVQMTQNPLDIQLGLISPGQRYEALKNWFRVRNIQDWGKYIKMPQGYTYVPSPEEEANRVLRGIETPILPNMDHEGFLAYVGHIFKHDELLGQFTPDQANALKAQAKRHEQMLQALQQMQAQQQNTAQMQMNAAQGSQGLMRPGVMPGQNNISPQPQTGSPLQAPATNQGMPR